MKKILILTAILCSLTSCENNSEQLQDPKAEFDKNIELFLESVEIIPQGRVVNLEGTNSKIFTLKLHDSSYKPLKSYALDGEEFVDDGTYNDKIANDGIYTSVQTQNQTEISNLKQYISIKSEKFKYISDQTNLKTNGGEIGCKIRHVNTGKSLFGFSCAANIGCFELYDCSFKITWN
jgi:hypothetical protein